ncbi:multiple epidermal growth factor-like domains 6 [Plakobranchus ocellatus]|uniref:Multiple epidermal growth factor-like domains 6 n=1 Tax=Plakobranchus ocellatus TaxID=259542 RepID=A0AAV4CQD3_9GAST|nr:multiple epidermal growth factor-like domains 6 [Plakobranchus ocellatus]
MYVFGSLRSPRRYTGDTAEAKSVYHILENDPKRLPMDNFYVSTWKRHDVLTLCEVQVFGDSTNITYLKTESWCGLGWYGPLCEQKCNCRDGVQCLSSNGGCLGGCKRGYKGVTCDQACEAGAYGVNCENQCSKNCLDKSQPCDRGSGACKGGCDPPFIAPLCHYKGCARPGWFGEDCEFQCHCMPESQGCNNLTGECLDSRFLSYQQGFCADGWIGLGCQFRRAEMIGKDGNKSLPEWMTDQDDSTCNSDASLQFVSIHLKELTYVDWIRLVVNQPVGFNDLHLSFLKATVIWSSATCTHLNATRAVRIEVSDKTYDYICWTSHPVNTIQIKGRGVSHLCGIYVSAGQHLMIKQDRTKVKNNSAVCPDAQQRVQCTNIPAGAKRPHWTLQFQHEVLITSIQLKTGVK